MKHYKLNITSATIILTVFGLTFLFALQRGQTVKCIQRNGGGMENGGLL